MGNCRQVQRPEKDRVSFLERERTLQRVVMVLGLQAVGSLLLAQSSHSPADIC